MGLMVWFIFFFCACLSVAVVPVGLLLCPSRTIDQDLILILLLTICLPLALCTFLLWFLRYGLRKSKREHTNKMRRITEVEMAKVYRECECQPAGLQEVLATGTIALLSTTWLLEQLDGFKLLRRQDLQRRHPEAFMPPERTGPLFRDGRIAAAILPMARA
jgi:hypothetical protein